MSHEFHVSRRVLLESLVAAPAAFAAQGQSKAEIPMRPLGKTGLKVSALGIGGYHLGSVDSDAEATQIVNEALDAGVNFFDNAWEYHNGLSEERLGRALKGKRDRAVLMTKACTHGRSKDVAMRQLEESLTRLQTDHLDVWQIHEVIYQNDPELIFAPN
ncbi:MAG TPA: aldo/keto reductase, partial [Bryobacteraceae bacterium]|nr:aldo/keto reductase [Bryobacteraceae bacterium]